MPDVVKSYFLGFIIAFLLLGSFIILLSLLYSRKQIRNRKEKELIRSQFAQSLLQTQLEIQEQTLKHVGRELHDNLGQVASLIKINLNTLSFNDINKATDKIESTKELIRQLIGDLKLLSVSLGADRIAEIGLSRALKTEVERLNRTGQFNAVITEEGIMPALDSDKTLILYRMAQEVLNNMVKHSGAKQIIILLHATENLLTLALTDDGSGFDIDAARSKGGAGLHNLENRAALINARLTMDSKPGKGTRISIDIPI